jgi:hypothetical protein
MWRRCEQAWYDWHQKDRHHEDESTRGQRCFFSPPAGAAGAQVGAPGGGGGVAEAQAGQRAAVAAQVLGKAEGDQGWQLWLQLLLPRRRLQLLGAQTGGAVKAASSGWLLLHDPQEVHLPTSWLLPLPPQLLQQPAAHPWIGQCHHAASGAAALHTAVVVESVSRAGRVDAGGAGPLPPATHPAPQVQPSQDHAAAAAAAVGAEAPAARLVYWLACTSQASGPAPPLHPLLLP